MYAVSFSDVRLGKFGSWALKEAFYDKERLLAKNRKFPNRQHCVQFRKSQKVWMLAVVMLAVRMLAVVMLASVMLAVVLLAVVMLAVVMLGVVMLAVVMLAVVMLGVVKLAVVMLAAVMLRFGATRRNKFLRLKTKFLCLTCGDLGAHG